VRAGNGHARRLDRIASKLPLVRPSAEVLEQEMDRLIALMQARERGEPSVGVITPRWPHSDIKRWVDQIIEELVAEEGRA